MHVGSQDPTWVAKINEGFGRFIPENLMYDDIADDPCVITSKLKDFYLNDRNVSNETAQEYARMIDDRLMTHCIAVAAEEYAKHSDVFLFNFTKFRSGSTPSN